MSDNYTEHHEGLLARVTIPDSAQPGDLLIAYRLVHIGDKPGYVVNAYGYRIRPVQSVNTEQTKEDQ